MDDLVTFLRARLDETDAIAQAAHSMGEDKWMAIFRAVLYNNDEPEEVRRTIGQHIAELPPARVLAEVEAKRRIVATFVEVDTHPNRLVYAQLQQQWVALRAVIGGLALPYADHPAFREEWRI